MFILMSILMFIFIIFVILLFYYFLSIFLFLSVNLFMLLMSSFLSCVRIGYWLFFLFDMTVSYTFSYFIINFILMRKMCLMYEYIHLILKFTKFIHKFLNPINRILIILILIINTNHNTNIILIILSLPTLHTLATISIISIYTN